jgi:hypothetical protein
VTDRRDDLVTTRVPVRFLGGDALLSLRTAGLASPLVLVESADEVLLELGLDEVRWLVGALVSLLAEGDRRVLAGLGGEPDDRASHRYGDADR